MEVPNSVAEFLGKMKIRQAETTKGAYTPPSDEKQEADFDRVIEIIRETVAPAIRKASRRVSDEVSGDTAEGDLIAGHIPQAFVAGLTEMLCGGVTAYLKSIARTDGGESPEALKRARVAALVTTLTCVMGCVVAAGKDAIEGEE